MMHVGYEHQLQTFQARFVRFQICRGKDLTSHDFDLLPKLVVDFDLLPKLVVDFELLPKLVKLHLACQIYEKFFCPTFGLLNL